MNQKQAVSRRRQAWTIFAIVFFASTVAPFNQFKVPPLIPVLRAELGISIIDAGLLMSVFSIAGLALALPAGLLFRQLGPRRSGALALGATLAGALLGATASTGWFLVATRLIEGVGMGMVAVLALATIAVWFPPQERGLPIGIFTTWIPVGNFAMLNIAPAVNQWLGWRAVWLLGAAVTAIALALYFHFVDLPPEAASAPPSSGRPTSWRSVFALGAPAGAWFLAVAFSGFHASRVGFLTWEPTYLLEAGANGVQAASFLTSLNVVVTIPFCLLAGWVSDLAGSRKLIYTLPFALLVPLYYVIFNAPLDSIWIWMLVIGIFAAFIPAGVNSATPDLAKEPSQLGPIAGVVAIGRNAGQLAGPFVLGTILELSHDWQLVAAGLIGMSLVGLVAGLLVRVR